MLTCIETPRLILRQWNKSDLDSFLKINSDPKVMQHFPETYSEERTKQFYNIIQKEFSEHGYGLYAVEEKHSGNFIGFIGFHWAKFEADFCPCIEIGWRLDKEFWNKGYATEGAKACLEHGFTYLGFEKIYSFTTVENFPSQRVMQKIGMQFYCYFDHPALPDNHPQKPHVCYVVDGNCFHLSQNIVK